MPTPLEQYREWERTGGLTTVHVLQIDRGDGSAGNRLTLTDKPYVDKGVSGTRYHHTYPAPIHCIISRLETTETMDGTSIADIVLANGSGRFDELLQEPNPIILGKRFTVLRGDQSWSLLETDYPNRFIEVFRGQIDGVEYRRGQGEVVLKVSPVRYKMDNLIGAPDQPIGFGVCRNVPATLVDAGALTYRFNTIETDDNSTYFIPRDNGVDLVLTTDYTLVLESGAFKGQIQLTSPPAGRLTADLNWEGTVTSNVATKPLDLLKLIATQYLTDEHTLVTDTLDISAQGTNFAWCITNAAGSKLYAYDLGTSTIYQYTLADPISGSSYDSKSFNIGAGAQGAWLDPTDTYLYVIAANFIYLRTMSVPGDISTLGASTSFKLRGVGGIGIDLTLKDITLSDDEATLWVVAGEDDGVLHTVAIPTPRTLSGLSLSGTISLRNFAMITSPLVPCSFFKSSDGAHAYCGFEEGHVVQLDLPTADTLEEWVAPGRELLIARYSYDATITYYRLHPDGDRLYTLADGDTVTQRDLATANEMPRRLVSTYLSEEGRNNFLESPCGTFYQGQVPIGQAISDLLTSDAASFSVGRKGDIRINAYTVPDPSWDYPDPLHPVSPADFIGEQGQHIRLIRSWPPAFKVTVQFDKNYTLQSPDELAGSVDDAEYFSKPFRTVDDETTLVDYEDPREIIISSSRNIGGVTALAAAELAIWSRERYDYEIDCTLHAIPGYADFGVGSSILVRGDWGRDGLRSEPYFSLTGSSAPGISTPDSATNSVTGDFTIVMRVRFPDVTPDATRTLMSKWTEGGQEAFSFEVRTTGSLALVVSADGSSNVTHLTGATLADFGIGINRPVWLKVDFDITNGSNSVATFYYCFKDGNAEPDADDWISFDTTTGATLAGIHNSSAAVYVGRQATGLVSPHQAFVSGRVYRAILMSGIGGTVVSDFDPRRYVDGDATLSSPVSGEVWTPLDQNRFLDTRLLVTGRRVNWSENRQTITVFK